MTSQAQLTHVANVEDDSTDEAFEVFKYVKVGGRRGTLFVEREVADDAKQVRLRLRKHNAALSPNIGDSMREVEKAIRAQPTRLFRYAAKTGWLPDSKGFVTTYGTIDFVTRRQKNSAAASAQRSAAPRREARRRLGGMEKGSRSAVSLFRLGDHDPVGSLCRAGIEDRRAAVFRAKYLWVGENRQERNRSRRLHCRRGRPRGGTAELGGDIGRGR